MCVLSQILHISMRSCADFENENLLNLHKVSANLPWVPPRQTQLSSPWKNYLDPRMYEAMLYFRM